MDVTYKGKTYQLTADATLTNREFLGSWFDTQEGDPYTTEYRPGHRRPGQQVRGLLAFRRHQRPRTGGRRIIPLV